MNLYEFLSHAETQLPLSWDHEKDFQTFVRSRLDSFCERIDHLDSSSVAETVRARKPAITKCCENIVRSIDASLAGRLFDAYGPFDLAMRQVRNELDQHGPTLSTDAVKLWYRVRRTQIPKLEKKDLFHIPFEERHKVPSHRYSIPGLPCLYLAGSVYTCWEEMGRPPFHELQASAFWLKKGKSIKVLNLSDRPSQLILYLEQDGILGRMSSAYSETFLQQWIAMSIVLWPLMASASIKVKHRGSPFRPEYVVPQMLMQWVMTGNDGFDGILYFSTNVHGTSTVDSRPRSLPHSLPACSLVLPTREIRPEGMCSHLLDIFDWTEPYGWEFLRAIEVGNGECENIVPWFCIEFIEGTPEAYYCSEFGEVEAKLNRRASKLREANTNGTAGAGDAEP